MKTRCRNPRRNEYCAMHGNGGNVQTKQEAQVEKDEVGPFLTMSIDTLDSFSWQKGADPDSAFSTGANKNDLERTLRKQDIVLDYLQMQLPNIPQDLENVVLKHCCLIRPTPKAGRVKNNFLQQRDKLAQSFLRKLDREIADGRISKLTASTGGVKVVWNNRFRTTAGQAQLKRVAISDHQTPAYHYYAKIELSDKLVNSENRLQNVLTHEFCHVASFVISNVASPPHGKQFKEWGTKCTRLFGHLGVVVSTTHPYE